jgi:hypothetical protein
MKSLLLCADGIIHGDVRQDQSEPLWRSSLQRLGIVILFGGCYGATMGAFGGVGGERWLQVLYAALKAPFLLLVTFALSLPSSFIFNALYGLRADYAQVFRTLLSGQAGLTVLLASLAPLTLLWNISTGGHQAAVLFNALMFGIATVGGQVLLRRSYRALLARDARHALMLRLWGVVYMFVGIQMAWLLRPFVGDPDKPVAFFRADAWGNAYVALFQLLAHVFTR